MVLAPLPPNCLHVVIDMQRLFAEETVWHTPALMQILPNVTRLCEASGPRTVYAKFITPSRAEAAAGQWQTYYRRWHSVTADCIEPSLFDLVAPLAEMSRNGHLIEKTTYSVFGTGGFDALLAGHRIDTLIFSGVETDVCVYASVLGAIDRGLRVILVTDAVASSDQAAHAAVIAHLLPRLPEQVEMVDTDALLPALVALNRL